MKVELISSMGDDYMSCQRARVSYDWDKKDYTDKQNDKLLKRLIDDWHFWVLEWCAATFYIECDIPTSAQIIRSRTWQYNFLSRRYRDDKNSPFEFIDIIPRKQNKDRTFEIIEDESIVEKMKEHYKLSVKLYNELIELGLCKEQARYVIPQGVMTKFYMTMNLRNWLHFLDLRLNEHAQEEVRIVAKAISDELSKLFPKTLELYSLRNK